MYAKLTDVRS